MNVGDGLGDFGERFTPLVFLFWGRWSGSHVARLLGAGEDVAHLAQGGGVGGGVELFALAVADGDGGEGREVGATRQTQETEGGDEDLWRVRAEPDGGEPAAHARAVLQRFEPATEHHEGDEGERGVTGILRRHGGIHGGLQRGINALCREQGAEGEEDEEGEDEGFHDVVGEVSKVRGTRLTGLTGMKVVIVLPRSF